MADAVSKRAAPLEVSIDKEPASPVDGKKQPPPPPSSPASMDKKEKPLVVVLVCLWALLNAAIFAGYAISELILNRHPCTTSTRFYRCVELTDAATAEAFALWRGLLWFAALEAAAAALALLFAARGRSPGDRWGAWALALVALAATAAGHYMKGRVDRIFDAAAPGDFAFDVSMGVVLLLIDLICFLCLVILGEGGDDLLPLPA